MSMVSNDYKTMGRLFTKYDIRGFLRNHGTTEIDTTDECLVSITKDIFRNDPEQTENVKLYEAINRFSGVLFGQYSNNTAVKKAVTTVTFVKGVCRVYNLLVRLKNHNKFNEYKKIVDAVNSIDILLRDIPDNINYTKLATMLADLYLNSVIEMGCERALVALKSDLEEQSEKTN